jgi:hypothetical protein
MNEAFRYLTGCLFYLLVLRLQRNLLCPKPVFLISMEIIVKITFIH